MNVCHFGFSLSLISGHSKPAFELAHNLEKNGVNVKILSSELPEKYLTLHKHLLESAQISIEEYRPFRSEYDFVSSGKKEVINRILSWADIIHVYGPNSLFLLQKCANFDAKVVLAINSVFKMSLSDMIDSGLSSFKNLITPSYLTCLFPHKYFSLTLSKADAIICWTRFMQKQVESLGINNSFLLPVGVNHGNFNFKRNIVVDQHFTFLYMGYLASARGISDLLNAFELVQQEWASTRLIIMHTGLHPTEQDHFLDRIRKSKSKDSIEVTGFATNLSEAINRANTVVLPFRTYVGYSQPPLTVLEALAHGRPVITTNVGCLPEIIQNDYNGFCIQPSNHKLLAKHMLSMRQANLDLLSENAREYILRNNDWSKICRSTQKIYASLLSLN